jgi:hypothetical protein
VADINRDLADHITDLKHRNQERDRRMQDVHLVRTGRSQDLFADLFPSSWPKPVVANAIDVFAQDSAEQVGVLPTFSASGDSILSEGKRNHADRLTKIINYYMHAAKLGQNLTQGADYFLTYGFMPVRVEPNFEENRPHLHLDNPMGAYFERNQWGRVTSYAKIFRKPASELAALFPEHYDALMHRSGQYGGGEDDPMLEVCRWFDDDTEQMIVLSRGAAHIQGRVLAKSNNALGECPVAIAQRPTVDGEVRGSFDDILWVFAAKAKIALLSLEAVQKSVEAPIALPQDVQEIAFGPDSILRSSSPEKIRRIPMELPRSAVMEDQILDGEMKFGARYPDVRAGVSESSIVTGKGVQALQEGFDSRVKTAQLQIGDALARGLSLALKMDERIWTHVRKDVSSTTNGTPYQLRYTPHSDIRGDYSVNFEFGVMAGLDPNRALVWGLQGLGAGLFSKSYLRRNLPVSMDVLEEEKIIDIERLREASLMSLEQYAQTIPQMAANGQDPIETVMALAEVIAARKKGTPIEEALEEVFTPEPEPEPEPMGIEEMAAAETFNGGQMPPGMEGGMPQAAPGAPQIDVPPQPPSMQQLLSGLRGDGSPTMGARTMRQTRV